MNQQPKQANQQHESSRFRRITRRLLIGFGFLLAIVWAMPHMASTDILRDRVLNAALPGSSLYISSDSASFSWSQPASVDGLSVHSPDNQLNIDIGQIRFDRTWWQLWKSPRDLGHLRVANLNAAVDLDWQGFDGYSAGALPQFSATLQNANLLVQLEGMDQPVIDVHQVDVELLRIDQSEGRQQLAIDKTISLDDRQLTAERCSELLQLLDPMLRDVVQVEGQFSLQIDRLRLPLNVDAEQQRRQMQMAGRLALHDVTASAKTPLIKGIVRVAADIHGKPPSEIVRVVNRSTVALEIRDGRVYHSGLEFGLPDIDPDLLVRSQGFVGLDESVELRVLIPKLFLAEGAEDEVAAKQIAELQITGTITEPEVTRLDQPKENSIDGLSANPASNEPSKTTSEIVEAIPVSAGLNSRD